MQLKYLFQLNLALETEKFNKLLNRVYHSPKGEYLTYSDNDEYVDSTLASKGITVTYRDSSKKKIKLTVDPNWILVRDGVDDNHIARPIRKLETHIGNYFKSEYELNDFKLSKMGIITDIDVRERGKVAAYMKILQKTGKVKGFSPANDNRLNNEDSFCLKGNSNATTFLIYDLEKLAKDQLMEVESKKMRSKTEKAEGILRTEVWLAATKAIRHFTDETFVSEQIADLSINGEKIFFDIFMRIVPIGDLYKKNKAVEIIATKVNDRTLRWKMLRLLELIPEKKSLLLAQKALNCRRIDDVMEMFSSIEVSPVTISKRHEFKKLRSLYRYL